MMLKTFRVAMVAALMGSAALATPPAGERLVHTNPSPFVVGFHAANADQSIEEWVPSGENVDRWTRMLTYQRFTNLVARGEDAPAFARRMQGLLRGACAGVQLDAITTGTENGTHVAQFGSRCPRNPQTGLPETTFFKMIDGASDLHVAQVAFRHAATADEVRWAHAQLASVVLCGPRSAAAACQTH